MDWTGRHKRFLAGDSDRRSWQNPEEILSSLALKRGDIFVDIGCGEGFFAIPASRIVGPKGTVYGVDIDQAAIRALEDEAASQGLSNLVLRAGPAEETVFCDSCADLVFFGIDLHDFTDAGRVLQNARKMVASHGRLADLDWRKEKISIGPPFEIRFSEETASRLIATARFRVESVTYPGPYHYLIVASPI